VPNGAKFGYDVLVYAGKGFFLRCRNAKWNLLHREK
jgi:hypothetical protein